MSVPEANDPPMGGEADRAGGGLLAGWGMGDDEEGGGREGGGLDFSKVVMARRWGSRKKRGRSLAVHGSGFVGARD